MGLDLFVIRNANSGKAHLKWIHLHRRPEFYSKHWGAKVWVFSWKRVTLFKSFIFHIFHLTKLQLHSKSWWQRINQTFISFAVIFPTSIILHFVFDFHCMFIKAVILPKTDHGPGNPLLDSSWQASQLCLWGRRALIMRGCSWKHSCGQRPRSRPARILQAGDS